MKRLLLLSLLACAPFALAEPGDAADMEARAKRLQALVADLESTDSTKREDAVAALLASGEGSIPFLQDAINRKGTRLHVLVLQKLMQQGDAQLPTEMRLSKEDLQAIVKERLSNAKAKGREYLYHKYLEAIALDQKGQFEAALSRAKAILAMEPGLDFANDLQKLRKKCEQQVIGAYLVRPSIQVSKPICADNTMVRFTFNLTNMSNGTVTIWFGDPAEATNQAVARRVVESEVDIPISEQIVEPDGTFLNPGTTEQQKLGRYSVVLEKGATVKLFEIERLATADDTLLKIIHVSAKLRFFQIDGPGGGFSTPMELLFPEEVSRVFPGNLAAAQKDPLGDMIKAINAKDARSTYLFANLIPEADVSKAIEVLIQNLKLNLGEEDQMVLRNCLGAVSRENFHTNKDWFAWYEEQQVKKKKEQEAGIK